MRRRPRDDVAYPSSKRVDAQLVEAGGAPQVPVVARFDPRLPNRVAATVPLLAELFQLHGGDLAHVAEHVRSQLAVRVVPQIALYDLHAREVLRPFQDVEGQRLRNVLLDLDRRKRIAAVAPNQSAELQGGNSKHPGKG